MTGTSLEDLRVLQLAESVADAVWNQTIGWKIFAKETVGSQLVRAADSIGANIAEAFGRYHFGEKIQFLYYHARGSLYETNYWINRAIQRQLLTAKEGSVYADNLSRMAQQLNTFVRSLKSQRTNSSTKTRLKEEPAVYLIDDLAESDFIPRIELEWLLSAPSTPLPQSLISYLQSHSAKGDANDD